MGRLGEGVLVSMTTGRLGRDRQLCLSLCCGGSTAAVRSPGSGPPEEAGRGSGLRPQAA